MGFERVLRQPHRPKSDYLPPFLSYSIIAKKCRAATRPYVSVLPRPSFRLWRVLGFRPRANQTHLNHRHQAIVVRKLAYGALR